MAPDEVTIDDLYAYHDARKAPVRANREITVLGKIYRYAIRWRATTKNPTIGFIFAEEKERERNVTGSERRRFAANYCPDWMRGYLALKFFSGRRQGEMLKLTTFSEKPNGITFTLLKKRKQVTATVLWSPRLRRVWEWLKALPRPDNCPYIFYSHRGKTRGKQLSQRGFKSAWQRAQAQWIKDGNEAFWEHDIRAASATASRTIEEARERLQHESKATTRGYMRGPINTKVKPLR